MTALKQSSFLIVFFDGMKVVIWLRIERVQRIIAIQGVSLVRILNLPSLDRSVGEILNIPSGIVGRENLSGESLVSCAPSRFSLEILPPSSAVGDIHESLPPSLSRSGRIYGSSLARPPVLPYYPLDSFNLLIYQPQKDLQMLFLNPCLRREKD